MLLATLRAIALIDFSLTISGKREGIVQQLSHTVTLLDA